MTPARSRCRPVALALGAVTMAAATGAMTSISEIKQSLNVRVAV